jgi:hypothetical protein
MLNRSLGSLLKAKYLTNGLWSSMDYVFEESRLLRHSVTNAVQSPGICCTCSQVYQ